MKIEGRAADSATIWIWGACLLAGWVVAFLAAFGIASTLLSRDLLPGMDTNLRWDLAFLNATMGVLGLVAVLGVRRIVFGSWPRVRPWHLLIPSVGVVISIAQDLVLHEWVEVRIGQYDFDHVAPTAVLSWATILVAVSVFAVFVAPRGRALPPSLGLWAASSVVLLITFMNAPGLGDGIEPESWTLATLIGMSAMYAIGCALVAAWQARRA
jgi:hypothetical protein